MQEIKYTLVTILCSYIDAYITNPSQSGGVQFAVGIYQIISYSYHIIVMLDFIHLTLR